MKVKNNYLTIITSTAILMSISSFSWANKNLIEPIMVAIPAGEFLMGSEQGSVNQQPTHKVNISSFYMGKYEVTVKEYSQFVQATGYQPKGDIRDKCMTWERQNDEGTSFGIALEKGAWNDEAYAPSKFHPVLCVSSEDILAYTHWLAKETGKKYRLPSEAEWEYAARAGSNSEYFFGDDALELCSYGNVFDQRGEQYFKQKYALEGTFAQCDDRSEFTSVVGMYKANQFGLYDTIGNVSEMLSDCEHKSYVGAPKNGSAWTTNCDSFRDSPKMQIHRGGAYGLWSPPKRLRSAERAHIGPFLRSSIGVGFRLALDSSSPDKYQQSQATTSFANELKLAQKEAHRTRQLLDPFPKQPVELTMKEDAERGGYILSWQVNLEEPNITYNVYRSETFGGKYALIARNIEEARFIDKHYPSRKVNYVVTAQRGDNVSVYSQPIATKDVVKDVSDVIQAEDFNQKNGVLVGNIKSDEDVGGGLNLTGAGGINKGDWVEYTIDVKSEGYYRLDYRIASAAGSEGFALILNGEGNTAFSVPETGGWKNWQTVTGKQVYLAAGQHKVKLKAVAGGWKLNWFSFNLV